MENNNYTVLSDKELQKIDGGSSNKILEGFGSHRGII